MPKKRKSKKTKLVKSFQSSRMLVAAVVVAVAAVGLGLYASNRNPESLAGGTYCAVESVKYHATQSPGMRGDCVKHLQNGLNVVQHFGRADLWGIPNNELLVTDGIYGAKTKTKVLAFQLKWNDAILGGRMLRQSIITVDGIAGPQTWAALHYACSQTTHRLALINRTVRYDFDC